MWRKCHMAPALWLPLIITTIPLPFITLASPPPLASSSPSKTPRTSPLGRSFINPTTSRLLLNLVLIKGN
ncbi:uncharacterized protein G2W53_040873 [Senna tora]|uniref:Secreted protein n=1 Tax=Senna tora TaxID=362788 RepID=A0A834SEA2_9FABA|nr:uncharacterized protein G2W53_040873 [Senna tora]